MPSAKSKKKDAAPKPIAPTPVNAAASDPLPLPTPSDRPAPRQAPISEREKCAREIEALANDRIGFVREEFLAAAKMLRSK